MPQVRPSNVTRPVLLNVLERAVNANGWKQLPLARQRCVGEIRARLDGGLGVGLESRELVCGERHLGSKVIARLAVLFPRDEMSQKIDS